MFPGEKSYSLQHPEPPTEKLAAGVCNRFCDTVTLMTVFP